MAMFCTIAQLKSFAGITVATYDADLTLIVENVSGAMQSYMQREIVSTVHTDERHSFTRSAYRLVLRQRPIISVQEVRVDDAAIAAAEYVIEAAAGILYNPSGWPTGVYHIEVDYTAGYATVPAALVGACIHQSRYVWTQAKNAGDRFGLAQRAEGGGGSTAFIVQDWYPGVEAVLRAYRRLA